LREHPEDVDALTREVLELPAVNLSRGLYLRVVGPRLPQPARHTALRGWLDEAGLQISALHGVDRAHYLSWLVPVWPKDKLGELVTLLEHEPLLERWQFELEVAKRRDGRGALSLIRAVVRESWRSDDAEFCHSAAGALRSVTVAVSSTAKVPLLALDKHLAEIRRVTEDRARGEESEELVSPAERALKLALGEPSFSVYQMVEASFSHHWHAARSRVLECLEDLSPGLERAAGALWAASLLDPAVRRELVDLATATLGPAPDDDNLVECPPITQRAEVEKLDEMLRFHPPFGGSVVARAERVLGFSRALGPAEQSTVANTVFEYARCLGDPKRIDVGLLAIVAMKASDRAIAARELLAWANAVVDDPYGKAVALAAAAGLPGQALARWSKMQRTSRSAMPSMSCRIRSHPVGGLRRSATSSTEARKGSDSSSATSKTTSATPGDR